MNLNSLRGSRSHRICVCTCGEYALGSRTDLRVRPSQCRQLERGIVMTAKHQRHGIRVARQSLRRAVGERTIRDTNHSLFGSVPLGSQEGFSQLSTGEYIYGSGRTFNYGRWFDHWIYAFRLIAIVHKSPVLTIDRLDQMDVNLRGKDFVI